MSTLLLFTKNTLLYSKLRHPQTHKVVFIYATTIYQTSDLPLTIVFALIQSVSDWP